MQSRGIRRRGIGVMLAAMLAAPVLPGVASAACPAPGQWATPAGDELDRAELFAELAQADAVLLGERHDRMDHHRWQLGTLAALHGQRPDMVIGLEMLPRSVQPVLDEWVSGELDADAFLRDSDWYSHWGFDPALYWPILHFARVHDVPLVALNAERTLVQRLGQEGWDAVPEDERYGVSQPADPPEGYREYLVEVMERHPAGMERDPDQFIGSQLVWDRMMAAGIADVLGSSDEPPLVVGIIGSGHLQYGHGVPHQLADLGFDDAPVLLPREHRDDCSAAEPDLARAVFGITDGDRFDLATPLLGVQLRGDEGRGVIIQGVQSGSVGEAAGLEGGDRVLRAGDQAVERPSDLQRIVQRVTPGTWLPLEIERDGEAEERVARFPYGE